MGGLLLVRREEKLVRLQLPSIRLPLGCGFLRPRQGREYKSCMNQQNANQRTPTVIPTSRRAA